MSDDIRLNGVTVNAPDALALARFYAEVIGGSVVGDSRWAAAFGAHGTISFQQAADFQAPDWPGDDVRMHLDFFVDDLGATQSRVLAAGGTLHDVQPNADHCLVYVDPVGHPFCLSTWDVRGIVEKYEG